MLDVDYWPRLAEKAVNGLPEKVSEQRTVCELATQAIGGGSGEFTLLAVGVGEEEWATVSGLLIRLLLFSLK